MIQNLSIKKNPGPDGFMGKFHKVLKGELMPILLAVFQKIKEEGTLPSSFLEASVTLIAKPDKDTLRKGKRRAISPVNTHAKIITKTRQTAFSHDNVG